MTIISIRGSQADNPGFSRHPVCGAQKIRSSRQRPGILACSLSHDMRQHRAASSVLPLRLPSLAPPARLPLPGLRAPPARSQRRLRPSPHRPSSLVRHLSCDCNLRAMHSGKTEATGQPGSLREVCRTSEKRDAKLSERSDSSRHPACPDSQIRGRASYSTSHRPISPNLVASRCNGVLPSDAP
jgi:hypothetical protein